MNPLKTVAVIALTLALAVAGWMNLKPDQPEATGPTGGVAVASGSPTPSASASSSPTSSSQESRHGEDGDPDYPDVEVDAGDDSFADELTGADAKAAEKKILSSAQTFATVFGFTGDLDSLRPVVTGELATKMSTIDPDNVPDLGELQSVKVKGPIAPEGATAIVTYSMFGQIALDMVSDGDKWLVASYRQVP